MSDTPENERSEVDQLERQIEELSKLAPSDNSANELDRLRRRLVALFPALDGIASRKDEAYLLESLVNPNAKLAEGYTATPISPMPPLNLILKPQEFADVKAFILSLK